MRRRNSEDFENIDCEKALIRKRLCKKTGKCDRCPPHDMENGNPKKYGTRKPKSKDRKRGRL